MPNGIPNAQYASKKIVQPMNIAIEYGIIKEANVPIPVDLT